MNGKKHIEQENYLTWGQQFSFLAPLSIAEQQIYQANPQHLQHEFPDIRLFPDPHLSSATRQEPIFNLAETVILVGEDEINRKTAKHLQNGIFEKCGVQLEVISDSAELNFWTLTQPIILVGGVQHNRWSRGLAQTLQLGVFNRDFPGLSGWGITTYQGIQEGLGIRYVLACDESTRGDAVDYFLQHAIVSNEVVQLQWIHKVQVGPGLPAEFHNFDTWLGQRPQTLLDGLNQWLESDHQRPYREVFKEVLLSMREGPIIANAPLLDLGLEAIRFYQMTSEEPSLELFREMMWGFWEYFQDDSANIYISDMDFRLGQICAYWNWIESHPAITPEEREIFPQLLLGAMRIVHGYYLKIWAAKPSPPGVRHNHQTFKARCLLFGWRYFQQFQVPDAELWKRDADSLFQAMDASRLKYGENANGYETLAPDHLLAWHEITNREISSDFQHALAMFARREWALTDNFFYRVEYGDCDVTFHKKKPFQVAPWLDANNPAFSDVIALEHSTAEVFAPEIPAAIYSFGKIQEEPVTKNLDQFLTDWTYIPLEPKLQEQFSLEGQQEQWFDKLAWKSGWQDSSAYLAIEGFGNETVSHAHNATNSVIRANFGGRVWLVGNGYGKPIGVKSAGPAFSTRERGPVDHNMLILRTAEGDPVTPPVNALLIDHGKCPIPFSVTELREYGGCKWIRHTFLLAESGLIVIDSLISETPDGLPADFSLEWNILGRVTKSTPGAVIEQSGVQLAFQHFNTAKCTWGYNASASWHRVMGNKEYPHTSNPLEKCVMIPNREMAPESNAHHFVSGFWLEQEIREAQWNAESLVLNLRMRKPLPDSTQEYSGGWGSINFDGDILQIGIQKRNKKK